MKIHRLLVTFLALRIHLLAASINEDIKMKLLELVEVACATDDAERVTELLLCEKGCKREPIQKQVRLMQDLFYTIDRQAQALMIAVYLECKSAIQTLLSKPHHQPRWVMDDLLEFAMRTSSYTVVEIILMDPVFNLHYTSKVIGWEITTCWLKYAFKDGHLDIVDLVFSQLNLTLLPDVFWGHIEILKSHPEPLKSMLRTEIMKRGWTVDCYHEMIEYPTRYGLDDAIKELVNEPETKQVIKACVMNEALGMCSARHWIVFCRRHREYYADDAVLKNAINRSSSGCDDCTIIDAFKLELEDLNPFRSPMAALNIAASIDIDPSILVQAVEVMLQGPECNKYGNICRFIENALRVQLLKSQLGAQDLIAPILSIMVKLDK